MICEKNLDEISDGNIYCINDMVKADSNGCDGCSDCCHSVGILFSLTPYDVYEIQNATKVSFNELIGNKIELISENKINLPHLKMIGKEEKCSFLDVNSRCTIHSNRPGVCRLFPLGRIYLEDDIKYFLQNDACSKSKLNKVKVKKWIGIENYKDNKEFLILWHNVLKALKFKMKFVRDEESIQKVNKIFLDSFFVFENCSREEFYNKFKEILPRVKNELGIL